MKSMAMLGMGVLLGLATGCGDEKNEETTTGELMSGTPSVLVDLDPESAGMTLTVENITARGGMLYTGDRESGDVLRIDPATASAVVVGSIPDRTDAMNMPLKANAAGLVFTAAGDLLIASGPFGEVVRLPPAALDATSPGSAETFATATQGANSLLLDGAGNLFVSGGNTGNVYKVGPAGGAASIWAQIPMNTRSVPPDNFMQSVVSNGMAFDEQGDLLVADTSRGAIWRIAVDDAGGAGAPEIMVQNPLLEGVDGIAFDARGRLWAAVNELNALMVVTDDEVVEAYRNDNTGPLEFPAALVFVDNTGYVVNFDRARRDNLAPDGSSSLGVGASIAQFRL